MTTDTLAGAVYAAVSIGALLLLLPQTVGYWLPVFRPYAGPGWIYVLGAVVLSAISIGAWVLAERRMGMVKDA